MKILIMSYNNSSWYKNKLGKVYKVQAVKENSYVTKDGLISKKDVEVIEK